MRTKVITALFLIIVLSAFTVSCTQRKQSPPKPQKNEEEQKSKGYIIFINTEMNGQKTVLYRVDIAAKKKEKIFDKNPYFAAGYGEKIAFMSRESGKQTLYMINADGSGLTSILGNMAVKENSLSWSPDGVRLAFIAREPEDTSDEVYYVEAGKNKTPVKVTNDTVPQQTPRFSSDGKMLFYAGLVNNSYDIFKYDLANQTSTNISNNGSNDISPVVSSDGTKVLFLSDEKETGKYNLYMMDMDGGSRMPLTAGLNIVNGTVRVSPDSSMVSFVTIDERKNKTVQIINMKKDTVMISDDAYLTVWSGDSKMLYYSTFDPKNRKIIEYDVVGKTMSDILKIEYKPGEEIQGIKFLHFTDKLK